MATDYTGGSAFWTSIKKLADTELVTSLLLYTGALLKLQDRGNWLRDEIDRRFARLASQVVGTKGVSTGSIDLSTLVYDPTTGALNGLTLTVESDTSGAVVVTFGTGGGAPTSPADVVSQINTATSSDPVASLTAGSLLQLSSVTSGGSGTVEVVSGSAVAVLGLTVGVATGASTGGDGASQVGAPAQGALSAGTLKAQLAALDTRATSLQARHDLLHDEKTYAVADATSAHASEGAAFTTASFVNSTTVLITFTNLLAGDVLDIECSAWAAHTGLLQGFLRLGNTIESIALSQSIAEVANSTQTYAHIRARYVMPADDASLAIHLQGRVTGGSMQVQAGVSLTGRVFRP